MAKKVRSARGVIVDFDLLKVKQQIAESPAIDVSARENFVEKRLRRRTKRTVASPIKPLIVEPAADLVDEAEFEPDLEDAIEPAAPAEPQTKRSTAAKPIKKPQQ